MLYKINEGIIKYNAETILENINMEIRDSGVFGRRTHQNSTCESYFKQTGYYASGQAHQSSGSGND